MQTSSSTGLERSESDQPWLAPVAPDLVWFGGDDSVGFLNDLISQEIATMAEGEVRRSFLLVPQGKLDHILWVVRTEHRVGLITDPGRGEELVSTLSRYRIRVDVEIEAEQSPVWLVMGEWDGFDISWDGVARTLVIGDQPDLSIGSTEDYESARINAGEVKWGSDVSAATIPHETALVALSVDFTKGCYLGQELVARIDSRGGNAPRFVRLIELADHADPGTSLTMGETDVGTLTSVDDKTGLATVHRSVAPGETVSLGSTTGIVREITRKSQT